MDEGVIDFAGLERDSDSLVLTIADHLAWGVEADDVHLLMLQGKINDYLRFIEGGEAAEHFKQDDYGKVVIRVVAKHPFSEDCTRFLGAARPVIENAGLMLEWVESPGADIA
jgi:hypothetical protein